jgi:hypothetical protein
MHSLIRLDRQEPNGPRESIRCLLPIPKDQSNSRLKYSQENSTQNPTCNSPVLDILRSLSVFPSDLVGTKTEFSFGAVSWL